jgi:NAD(P)-dependent dehydrogenase (short-subunit alcohol dehydrogenase family)
MDLGFNRVHVLVTGAAGGIGFETVQQFLGVCDPGYDQTNDRGPIPRLYT